MEDKDVVEDKLLDIFLQNISPVKDYIVPIQKSSLDAAKDFTDESIEFIF
jgi:hypothetical protein